MSMNDPKDVLRRYLEAAHEALLWKIEGLSEYDIRRPLTPTGTNLLGILKHVAWVSLGYFGDTFDRAHGEVMPANSEEPNADMYALPEESRAEILALFARARAHAGETIAALDLDAPGHVPWWGDAANPVTLQRIMVHMTAEVHRHAGQADILREHVDGSAGYMLGNENMPPTDDPFWTAYYDQVKQIAVQVAGE